MYPPPPNEELVAEICEQLIYRQPDSSNIWELLATEMRLRDRDQLWQEFDELKNESYEYQKIRIVILIRMLYQHMLSQEFPSLLPQDKIFWQQVFEYHLKAIDAHVIPKVP